MSVERLIEKYENRIDESERLLNDLKGSLAETWESKDLGDVMRVSVSIAKQESKIVACRHFLYDLDNIED